MLTKEKFLQSVSRHEMTVKKNDGVYRHIVFSRPDSSAYRFHLTTFPEFLVITGDCGAYVFRRTHDMFNFFRNSKLEINSGYWREKCEAVDRRNPILEYSADTTKKNLLFYFEAWMENEKPQFQSEARKEFYEKILSRCDTEEGFQTLGDVDLDCGYCDEWYEHNTHEYTNAFQWCLYAIVWGITQFDEANKTIITETDNANESKDSND